MDIIFSILLASALLYVFVNAFLPTRAKARARANRPSSKLPKDSEGTFIVCAFSMLGKLAQADGAISQEEIQRVDDYIGNSLKLDSKLRELALSVFKEAGSSPLEMRDYAERFQKTFSEKVHLASELVTILLEVGASDGILALEEERNIRTAALLIGMSDPGFERLKQEILGQSPIVH